MSPGCPYFKKVNCEMALSTQAYCLGYASGKLRVPILMEEMCFCCHDENYKECNTYQFALVPKEPESNVISTKNIFGNF